MGALLYDKKKKGFLIVQDTVPPFPKVFTTDKNCCCCPCCIVQEGSDVYTCDLIKKSTCISRGGEVKCDAKSCDPSPCCNGACCEDGVCSIKADVKCNGRFKGCGTTCDGGCECVDREDCGPEYGCKQSRCEPCGGACETNADCGDAAGCSCVNGECKRGVCCTGWRGDIDDWTGTIYTRPGLTKEICENCNDEIVDYWCLENIFSGVCPPGFTEGSNWCYRARNLPSCDACGQGIEGVTPQGVPNPNGVPLINGNGEVVGDAACDGNISQPLCGTWYPDSSDVATNYSGGCVDTNYFWWETEEWRNSTGKYGNPLP